MVKPSSSPRAKLRPCRIGLERLEDRTLMAADWAEPNNSPLSAYNLGPVQGGWYWGNLSIHSSSDDDWFRFETDRVAGSNHSIQIDFNNALGDLELALYDANANFINYSAFAGVNRETVPLTGLPAGTYYARIYSYWGHINPSYTLTIQAPRDRFEENDSLATATDLGTVQGQSNIPNLSLDRPGDQDIFKFTLASPGSSGHYARIDFQHAWGDLGLGLRNAAGDLITYSNGMSNFEQVSLAGLSAGTYYLQVYGSYDATNIHYNLSINAPTSAGDRFEPNDFHAPTDLGLLTGQRVEDNLSIHSSTDHDWFKFQIAAAGTSADFVRIDFSNFLGDLELALYDTNGNFLRYSARAGVDSEVVPLTNLPAGTYYARVYSYWGHLNPYYKITFSPPLGSSSASGDALESNDTAATATNLGLLASGSITVRTDLSLHSSTDEDWFKFTLDTTGQTGNAVTIVFRHAQGDIDMELYDSTGTNRLALSDSSFDVETISLAGRAAGTYYVRVYGYNGARNPNYLLTITAPQSSSVSSDRYDTSGNNNSFTQATNLGTISGSKDETGLTITAGDIDLFKFTTEATATQAHAVRINFTQSAGNLTLELYDRNQNLLSRTAVSGTNSKSISLAGLPADTYYVRVAGATAATTNSYSLHLDCPTATAANDWTVMIYATASNLEPWSARKINQLERLAAELSGTVRFVILWDQTDTRVQVPDPFDGSRTRAAITYATGNGSQPAWGDTGLAIIQPDQNQAADWDLDNNRIVTPFERIGEKSTGDPRTLNLLIDYALANAPAANYMLLLQDHGGYFSSNNDMDGAGSPFPGPWDDSLTLPEIVDAMAQATTDHPGFRLKVLAYDTCLMGAAEVAYALRTYADYILGSEDISTTGTYNYYKDFQVLKNNPAEVTPQQLVDGIMTSIGETLTRNFTSRQNNWGTTYSAIDTSKLDNLAAKLQAFTAATANATAQDWRLISQARVNSDSFEMSGTTPESVCRDLGNFLNYLANQANLSAAIRTAATNAKAALDEAIVGNIAVSRSATGLSIYLPPPGQNPEAYYLQLTATFLETTGWSTFLTRLARNATTVNASSGQNAITSGASGISFNTTADWAGADNSSYLTAFDLHHLVGPGHVFPGLTLRELAGAERDQDWFKFTIEAAGTSAHRVWVNYDNSVASVRLTLYRASDPSTPVAGPSAGGAAEEILSLAGLAAGDYFLKVEFVGTPTFLPYTLSVNAPTTPNPAADWAHGNSTLDKAANLGSSGQPTLFSGLSATTQWEWFTFTTPVTQGTIQIGTLHIRPTGGQRLTVELYANGQLIRSESGTGELNLEYAYGSNQTYQLAIRSDTPGAPARYSIFFAGTNTVSGQPLFQDTFNRGNAALLGLHWTERTGDLSVSSSRVLAASDRLSVATLNSFTAADTSLRATISVPVSGQTAGLAARYSGSANSNMYWASLTNSRGRGVVQLWRIVNGVTRLLGSKVITRTSATLRFDVIGNTLSVFVNGALTLSAKDSLLSTGGVGLRGMGGTYDSFSAVALTSQTFPFLDNFNRANSDLLGTGWIKRHGETSIIGNKLAYAAGATTSLATANTLARANMSVQASIALSARTTQTVGLVARYKGPGDKTMYLAEVVASKGVYTARIVRNVNGRRTILRSARLTSGTGVLRFQVVGRSLKLYFRGKLVASTTDSGIAGAGYAGILLGKGTSVDNFDTRGL